MGGVIVIDLDIKTVNVQMELNGVFGMSEAAHEKRESVSR